MKTTAYLIASLAVFLAASQPAALADPAKPKGTPPGLAKKPGGMPPGQYKKLYPVGKPLPKSYVRIDDLSRWHLPPVKPGQMYVQLDGDIYRVARDTAIVLEAVGIVSDLLR